MVATLMILITYDAKEIGKNMNKRTYYRHLALLKEVGIELEDDVAKENLSKFKPKKGKTKRKRVGNG